MKTYRILLFREVEKRHAMKAAKNKRHPKKYIGVVMANRRICESEKAAIPKAVRAMDCGADLLMYPEGTWNLSPNVLILDLWLGIYRIVCEIWAKVVPIVHYLRDNGTSRDNPIHTVVDAPIRIDDLKERQALSHCRDIIATW